jgi:DNA-binding transcriptional regulator YhcF (GntR family)
MDLRPLFVRLERERLKPRESQLVAAVVLHSLGSEGAPAPLSARALAAATGLHPTNTWRALASLERKGVISRRGHGDAATVVIAVGRDVAPAEVEPDAAGELEQLRDSVRASAVARTEALAEDAPTVIVEVQAPETGKRALSEPASHVACLAGPDGLELAKAKWREYHRRRFPAIDRIVERLATNFAIVEEDVPYSFTPGGASLVLHTRTPYYAVKRT